MALKICEDCKKEISTLAVNCPNCGRPNANAGIVTIEKTQKKWKRWDVLGLLLCVPSAVYVFIYGIIHSETSQHNPIFGGICLIAIALAVIGILIVMASGIGRWYHHG